MENYYYRFWISWINNYLRTHEDRSNWKFYLLLLISHMMGTNLWVIFMWLKYFNIITIEFIEINIFPGKILNEAFSFFLTFNAIFFIVNYFLIFWRDRYKKLNEKYEEVSRKTLVVMLFVLLLIPFLTFAIISILKV